MLYLDLALCGVLAGITTVLFGFGGGFVAVPVLYALLSTVQGRDAATAMHIAVATSTCLMIFGAGMATWRSWRAGALPMAWVRPLLLPIAIGAALGASVAVLIHGAWLRWAFITYLLITILDSGLRAGFVDAHARAVPMGTRRSVWIGIAIGAIAALLGVGGSVMTVPLMRRRGASMAQAAAMANPLSLPMAMVGTAVFMLLAWQRGVALGVGYVGYVNVYAFGVLALGVWLGIRLGSAWLGRMSDRLHARVYLLLLCVVLALMLWL